MDWQEKYASKIMSADEAVRQFVKNGDRIFYSGAACVDLTVALRNAVLAGEKENITLDGPLSLTNTGLADPELSKRGLRVRSYFFGPLERMAQAAGTASYVPVVYSNMARHYRKHPANVCFLEVSPPDERGMCNLGCMLVGVAPSALETTECIIASVNEELCRVKGSAAEISIENIKALVLDTRPMPEYPVVYPDEIDKRISDIILDRVPDGACLQLGIGGMPNALGYGLREKRHLGIHTEMLTPSMIELVECGAVDNSRKGYMPGISVCGFFLGRNEHYKYLDGRSDYYFMTHDIINDPAIIAKNDNFISVNNALEVDLCGSVAADCVGFRQYSGVGGQIDFVRGAAHSKGGCSYIAMRSTYTDKKGELHSRILTDLSPGTQVTTPRGEVMCIVTEYGCAELFDEDIPTRAERLIAIAHPDFREKLIYEARKAGLLY